jgi:predicted phosphodiesterase
MQIDPAQEAALHLLSITHRVRLVLHGHLHRAEVRRVGGIRIIGAPASTQPMAGPDGKHYYYFFYHIVKGRKGTVHSELMHSPV